MRVAAIDLGTNTILLLVAERGPRGEPEVVEERAEIVRLGQGLDASGRLAPEAMARARTALVGFAARLAALGCARVRAVGTEALRKAANGAAFVAEADALLAPIGGRLEIIDGETEARLSFGAVRHSFAALTGPLTVLDIGGGSTELITGQSAPESLVSLPIGSVRLTERLLAHDPPTAGERSVLVSTIDAALAVAPALSGTLVGIAGTVTTLAAMAQRLTDYDGARVHGSILERSSLERTIDWLGLTPLADRRRAPGLEPGRADVIYAGAVILERVMRRAQVDRCIVSDRGVRWGLVYELLDAE